MNSERERPRNMILRALPRNDLDRIYPLLELVPLKGRRVLHHARMPIEHLYFIEEGLVSVVAKADERKSVEVWLIGHEGVAGLPLTVGRQAYARYYNDMRTHRSSDKDLPVSRPVQRTGRIMSHPLLGGLHHHYTRLIGTSAGSGANVPRPGR